VYFRNVLMLAHSLISVLSPRPKRHAGAEGKEAERMPKILRFLALQYQNTIAISQGYFVNVLMLVHSLISMLAPREKRCRENAENFAFLSAVMLEYYSYYTGVFCKCFNACTQLN